MIEFVIFGINIKFKFLFFAVISLLGILDKTSISMIALFSSLIHEFGHIIASFICKKKPKEISFETFGIRMFQPDKVIPYNQEMLILFSGPLLNIILAFIFLFFYKENTNFLLWGYSNLIIGIFNLIPIGNLDGGRILNIFLKKFLDLKKSYFIGMLFSLLFLIPIIFIAVKIIFDSYNFSLIVTAVYLFLIICNKGND
ncbi:MAG: hypothetical protein KFW09_00670 [Oscillospiraceae bacterium]|nr:hypothetical protein [Oscillospiraceae bacterium]